MSKFRPKKGSKKPSGKGTRSPKRKSPVGKPAPKRAAKRATKTAKKIARKSIGKIAPSFVVEKRDRSEAAKKGWKTRRKNIAKKRRSTEKGRRTRALRKKGIKPPKESVTKKFKYRYREYKQRRLKREALRDLVRAETEGGKLRKLMQGTIEGKSKLTGKKEYRSTNFHRANLDEADDMAGEMDDLAEEYGIATVAGASVAFTDMREGF